MCHRFIGVSVKLNHSFPNSQFGKYISVVKRSSLCTFFFNNSVYNFDISYCILFNLLLDMQWKTLKFLKPKKEGSPKILH